MSEFKISRLRFSWAGEWVDQKAYNKDEIVQYNGKAYVCLVPHTSNSFYNDLNAVIPKWELMMTGQTWKGTWEPITFYSLDNIIIFGGIVYKCNQEHLSGAVLDQDIDKWDVYAESKTWQSEWTSSTTYGVGDIVNYGGSVYECVVSHISAETDLIGLEADYTDIQDSTERFWKLLQYGVQWRGEYATETADSSVLRYKLNDIVKYGPSLYRCIWGHAPSVEFQDFADSTELYETFISQYWEEWLPGLDFDNVWNVNAIYQPGDVVLYGGYLFQSKLINNIGNKPSTNFGDDSTDAWELISKAYDMSGPWDTDTEYKVGNVVNYGGDLYVALVDSTGQNPGNFSVSVPYEANGSSGNIIQLEFADSIPSNAITVGMTVTGEGFARGQTVRSVAVDEDSTNATHLATVVLSEAPDGAISNGALLTFSGTNSNYWELLIPGFEWKGQWKDSTLYHIDDTIYWKNATYKCVHEHTSSLVTRPDNDLQNLYWVVYLQHDQRNSLSTPGEMVIYNNGNVPLQTGANGNVLKVVDGLPVWSDIDFTPNVYYVATNGEDLIDNGTTPDRPWATVKYACARVKEGTMRPNAKILLDNNKEWIVQETFYWFLYQQNQNIAPFDASYNFDNEKTIRDARLVVDGVIRDLIRGGNAQTVRAALSYFDLESTNKFTNETVAEQAEFFQVFFVQLFNNIEYALTNTVPPQNYQALEGVTTPVTQYFNSGITVESDAVTFAGALERIILEAFAAGSPVNIPPPNQGTYSTINIKSGTYNERLPIVVPANTALCGDELRGTTIQPAAPVNTLCTRTFGDINQFIVGSTVNMEHNTPVQFVSLNAVNEISTIIGDVIQGKTYYVIGDSITDTSFSVSETPDGPEVPLVTNIGYMYVYGGEALGDMFQVQNDVGIRNMTVKGLLGTLSVENEFLTRRPTGGAYVSFDPGTGPDDTSTWITARSPYVQNVTTFGKGCTGMKIDSTLHNGGNRSMVCNDFTQIISDGIGLWCKGGDALVEAVSVFSYYNYAGYFAEDGGRIRATNGNSSYGTYGVVAEGFDTAEIPATGTVNNQDNQAIATPVSALGANSEVLKIEFNHAGEEYFTETTNMLKYSNDLLDTTRWNTDGNLTIIRANTTPYTDEFAWKLSANTSLTDSAFIYQDVTIAPQGRTYTNVSGNNISGSGLGATFNVTVFSNRYVVSVNNGGSGYVVGNQIRIDGRNFGGRSPENDITVTVDSLSITSILTILHTGTVPVGSALKYNVSIHAHQGTASYFDVYTIFSGYQTKTSYVRFNFDTETISTQVLTDSTTAPTNLQKEYLENGWWRISYSVYDETAQNNSLRFKLYPRGIDGITGYTNFYGAQLQISDNPTFFLETDDTISTAYANVKVSGAGSGSKVIADELRSGSIFQTRLLEGSNIRLGGLGYKFQSNNAQSGTTDYLTLAQSEVATPAEYEGMRISIASGKGAGQYGIISNYTEANKRAYVTKESFGQQEVVAADAVTDRLLLGSNADFHRLYIDQKIQFTPTYYDITVSSSSQSSLQVVGTRGDLNNTMVVTSTDRLRVNQKINFSGETFGGVITGFDYYIIDVIDDTDIQISTSLGGAVWPLTNVNVDDAAPEFQGLAPFTLNYPDGTSYLEANSTQSMEVTLPIQFTGKSIGGVELGNVYYIHDVYNGSQFSISDSITDVTATATSSADNSITIADTSVLNPLNAIIFKDGSIGGIQEKTRYYVNGIVNGTDFTVSSGIITRTATATQAVTNLITVDSTAGFTVNSPVMFTGITFGQIDNDKVYYIQVINDATSFTVSEAPGGAALPLTTAVGEIIVRTVLDTVVQTDDTGSVTGTTPGPKTTLTAGRDVMEGQFYTEIFGGIVAGTTYYVLEKIDSGNSVYEIRLTATPGGTIPVALVAETGSMQINAVGWDHINAGTPLVNTFDSTSVYEISPRVEYDEPPFYKEPMTAIPALNLSFKKIVSSGFKAFALPQFGDRLYSTSNYQDWDQEYILPYSGDAFIDGGNGGWVDAVYGNRTWIILAADGQIIRSVSNGLTWLTESLPDISPAVWSSITYGNGAFVAVARGSDQTAYSWDCGATWNTVSDGSLGDSDWVDIAYGREVFVAISGSSHATKYSTDNGVTWTEGTLDTSLDSTVNNWHAIEFGNGRFVAISIDDRPAVYSFDGNTWYESTTNVSGTVLTYGQGLFIVINNDNSVCCTSTDGFNWDIQFAINDSVYEVLGFAFDETTKKGWFLSLDQSGSNAFRISGGAKAQGTVSVASQSITSINMIEPGSGYEPDSFGPRVTITDPNNSEEAVTQLRVGNGTLGAPTFVNYGNGYNTSSTAISIRGAGYSDQYQTGLRLIAKNITRFPSPGDNLQFEGNDIVYRVATATALRGSTAPNLEALIQLSPQIDQADAPEHNTPFTIRSRFSQVRLTNHDFLNIGFGNEIQSNYPNLPEDTGLEPQDEVQETNNGRVFYSSTDQDGNFRVGDLFAVEQATGIVTLSADEFGLDGLTELAIGGVALGGSPVTISAFSTDGTFVANSNNLVPTQRAIRTYLASRLSQGGSDTFTGLLTAGTVKVGGPDEITSTIPEGGEGWQVKIGTKANFSGPFGNSGWAGDGLAMAYFMKTFVDPTRSGQQ